MIISGSINEFVNNYTKSILESMDNVKLWQFSVTKSNSYNIKREYDEIEQNDFGLWSKPGNYDKYEDKNNVLLITDNENTHVLSFKGCDNPGRKWWDDKHTQNGIIRIELIGILDDGKEKIAHACNYKRFSIGNKFQPITKVTHREFLNNLYLRR